MEFPVFEDIHKQIIERALHSQGCGRAQSELIAMEVVKRYNVHQELVDACQRACAVLDEETSPNTLQQLRTAITNAL